MYNSELYHHGIKGMRWGVRRYRNKDGTLTAAGKKRYDRDVLENMGRKKENRIDTSKPDPNRWVQEDLNRRKRIIDTSSNLVNQAKQIERETSKTPKKRMDLSNMTDTQLRNAINREMLEKQYNNIFAPEEQVSKGRQVTRDTLDLVGDVLTVSSSALAIALAIRELRGK